MTEHNPSHAINTNALPENTTRPNTAIVTWLVCIALLVFSMIIVGGATRLTDSGLSITEWLPILGIIPPLSDVDWAIAFEKYKQIPEYEFVNKDMTIYEFKTIYWWEWAHRFLGRLIGLVFALPLFVFWLQGKLTSDLKWKLAGLLALGGLQGLIGWYMVQSGLVDRVDVSHYRLALHLTTAFVIFACLVWLIRDLSVVPPTIQSASVDSGAQNFARILLVILFAQIVFGAFVAGLKSGLSNNTWPLMNGAIIPSDLWSLSPWYLNMVENPTTVQFIHRALAYLLITLAAIHAWRLWYASQPGAPQRTQVIFLLAALLLQAVIGIWVLLAAPEAGQIPIGTGLMHQGGAAIVLAILVWHVHTLSSRSHQLEHLA